MCISYQYFDFSPLLPSAYKSPRIAKISFLKLKGIIKKYPMSVATINRQTKRAYLRLCVKKLKTTKQEFR